MPKTLIHDDNVPFFDDLVVELGNPFDALTFSVDDVAQTSPTDAPTLSIDERPFIDDDDWHLDGAVDWPLADDDKPLPPLTSAALSALASLDQTDDTEIDA